MRDFTARIVNPVRSPVCSWAYASIFSSRHRRCSLGSNLISCQTRSAISRASQDELRRVGDGCADPHPTTVRQLHGLFLRATAQRWPPLLETPATTRRACRVAARASEGAADLPARRARLTGSRSE